MDGLPGGVMIEDRKLLLQCADGRVELLEAQPEGRRRMRSDELINGLRDHAGIVLR